MHFFRAIISFALKLLMTSVPLALLFLPRAPPSTCSLTHTVICLLCQFTRPLMHTIICLVLLPLPLTLLQLMHIFPIHLPLAHSLTPNISLSLPLTLLLLWQWHIRGCWPWGNKWIQKPHFHWITPGHPVTGSAVTGCGFACLPKLSYIGITLVSPLLATICFCKSTKCTQGLWKFRLLSFEIISVISDYSVLC